MAFARRVLDAFYGEMARLVTCARRYWPLLRAGKSTMGPRSSSLLCSNTNTTAAPTARLYHDFPVHYPPASLSPKQPQIRYRPCQPRLSPSCCRTHAPKLLVSTAPRKPLAAPTTTTTPPQWLLPLSLQQQQRVMLAQRVQNQAQTGKCYSSHCSVLRSHGYTIPALELPDIIRVATIPHYTSSIYCYIDRCHAAGLCIPLAACLPSW
jgi:hypothetical protein